MAADDAGCDGGPDAIVTGTEAGFGSPGRLLLDPVPVAANVAGAVLEVTDTEPRRPVRGGAAGGPVWGVAVLEAEANGEGAATVAIATCGAAVSLVSTPAPAGLALDGGSMVARRRGGGGGCFTVGGAVTLSAVAAGAGVGTGTGTGRGRFGGGAGAGATVCNATGALTTGAGSGTGVAAPEAGSRRVTDEPTAATPCGAATWLLVDTA